MWLVRWFASKIATYWDILSSVISWALPIVAGIMSGWAAWAANLFVQYAPFSWVAAGLLGTLVGALIALSIGIFRALLVRASAMAKWRDRVDGINPLDSSFSSLRIKLADIVHPMAQSIAHKRFTNCELIGPANLYLADGNNMVGVTFQDCDIVISKDGAKMTNVVGLVDVTMIGGSLWKCTLFIHPSFAGAFQQMGAAHRFITLTGIPEFDGQAKPEGAVKT